MKFLTELTDADFATHPVWEHFGGPDTDARVVARDGMEISEVDSRVWLAATEFQFANGTWAKGFTSPADDSGLDYLQPVLFVRSRQVPLWRPGLGTRAVDQISAEIGHPPGEVFPIAWRSTIRVDGKLRSGTIEAADVGAG